MGHRVVAGSRFGRSLTSAKGTSSRVGAYSSAPQDIQAHNAAIDEARARELAERKQRREGKK